MACGFSLVKRTFSDYTGKNAPRKNGKPPNQPKCEEDDRETPRPSYMVDARASEARRNAQRRSLSPERWQLERDEKLGENRDWPGRSMKEGTPDRPSGFSRRHNTLDR